MTVNPAQPLWDPEPVLGQTYHPFVTQLVQQLAERRAALEEELCQRAKETGYGVMIIEDFPGQPLASLGMVHWSVPRETIHIHKWGTHIMSILGEHGVRIVRDKIGF
ncbi:hypothetical protein SEA_MAMAPEARL_58 [Arthrobacter phage MamaPearl]|uniref:Uncharacterized protein n=1 Tax=Arthrobacter phage MamaPearl TaxID=2743906 RepID=A0AAE7F7H6_9CAUD|nr:hypothetical protein KDJ03_gp58 [Arthrobacter phage MamaPearl]QDH48246.1 hypothetical protein SEA_ESTEBANJULIOR_58 [Arthrobacter phage EstebanJulior]QKY79128.1 hypothetical protein SEA_MAMAPEARL_58 [Arthrobacter phage MamaPearl]